MANDKTAIIRPRYDETKQQVSMTLTPTAIGELDKAAQSRGISRSELTERYARGLATSEPIESTPEIYPVGSYNVHLCRTAYSHNDSLIVDVVEPGTPLDGRSIEYGADLEAHALQLARHLYYVVHESDYQITAIIPVEALIRCKERYFT